MMPSRPAHSNPVRVSVPMGMSSALNTSPAANTRTLLSGGKIVPYLASHSTSGMTAMATQDRVEPSNSPVLSLTKNLSVP